MSRYILAVLRRSDVVSVKTRIAHLKNRLVIQHGRPHYIRSGVTSLFHNRSIKGVSEADFAGDIVVIVVETELQFVCFAYVVSDFQEVTIVIFLFGKFRRRSRLRKMFPARLHSAEEP